MEQQPAVAPSDSSDDPPVVPLNLPAEPVFTGASVDRPSTPACETGPSQSRYGTPRSTASGGDGGDPMVPAAS
eukprot:12639833-Alexandrium_andersonii.AAC.1